MSHFGILLVGLVVLGGLLLSLASLIVLIFCWKRRTLRWVFAGGLVLGLLPMVAYMTANSNYDPNDNEMAQAWCGSYSLSCSPYVELIIKEDSRFELSRKLGALHAGDGEHAPGAHEATAGACMSSWASGTAEAGAAVATACPVSSRNSDSSDRARRSSTRTATPARPSAIT